MKKAKRITNSPATTQRQHRQLPTEMTGSAVDLHFPKIDRAVNCVIDGELLPMGKDVALRLHAGELKVIVPRVEAQVAAPTTEAAA